MGKHRVGPVVAMELLFIWIPLQLSTHLDGDLPQVT
jgi:hypothetical protein